MLFGVRGASVLRAKLGDFAPRFVEGKLDGPCTGPHYWSLGFNWTYQKSKTISKNTPYVWSFHMHTNALFVFNFEKHLIYKIC